MNYTIKLNENGSFYLSARIKRNGKDFRIRETFTGSKRQAEKRGAEMVRELEAKAEADIQIRTGSLTSLKQCIEFYESKNDVKRENKPYFKRLNEDLGHVEIGDLPEAVEKYISQLSRSKTFRGVPFSAGFKNRIQAWIRAILNHAVEWDRIKDNPIRKIQKFKETPRDKSLSPEQISNLLSAIELYRPYLMQIVLFALQIPCRSSELTNAKRFDLDLKAGILRIRSGTTKNGNGINKPIPVDMLEYFHSIPSACPWAFYREEDGKYYQLKGFATAWRFVLEKAGIEDFRFHDLRHYAVTELANGGLSERQVMQVAGWKTNMLSTYYHRTESATTKAVQGILSAKVSPFIGKKASGDTE